MDKFVVISVIVVIVISMVLALVVCNINEKNDKVDIIDNVTNIENVDSDEIFKSEEPINAIDDILIRDPNIEPASYENNVTAGAEDLMDAIISLSEIEVASPKKGTINVDISEDYLGLSKKSYSEYVSDSGFYEAEYVKGSDVNLFCVLKINDISKVEELKKEMFENCAPDKWIYSSADRIVILSSGEYILFAMATYDNCERLVPAFERIFKPAIFGKSYDRIINSNYIDVNN